MCKQSRSHNQYGLHDHKNLFKIFSKTSQPMALKRSMRHWVLMDYHDCSNNELELTLTCFATRSNMGNLEDFDRAA